MSDTTPPPPSDTDDEALDDGEPEGITVIEIQEEMESSFLDYALTSGKIHSPRPYSRQKRGVSRTNTVNTSSRPSIIANEQVQMPMSLTS